MVITERTEPVYMRYGVRAAVTWRIVTEILRRHHKTRGLRILETHPGGGGYDCLSIGSSQGLLPFAEHLCDFNMGSQHLHLFKPFQIPRIRLEQLDWPDGNDYVQAFLSAPDPKRVVDQVEALLGLPPLVGKPPATNPSTLLLRVIAAVLEQYAFARNVADVRCAWHDSSGYEGTYVIDAWLDFFPDLAQRFSTLPLGGPWQVPASMAGRVWRIWLHETDAAVLLDLGSGRACWTGAPRELVSLWDLFVKSGRRIDPVVLWVMERLVQLGC